MKGLSFKKCFIVLGLLLFFTLLIPEAMPFLVSTAKASSFDKSNKDYRLNVNKSTLVKGDSFFLKVYHLNEDSKVIFKSDNTEIASVNKNGIITGNMVGVTTITATVRDGLESRNLFCIVTVGPPAFSVRMTKSRIIMGLDMSDQLRVIMKPSNTTENARFSSYNPSIADVSSGGRIIARNLGMTYLFAQIDATYYDGTPKYATCSVIITSPEDAPLLREYLSENSDIRLISEYELTLALEEFFNLQTDDITSVTPEIESPNTLVESFDKYLHERIDFKQFQESDNKA